MSDVQRVIVQLKAPSGDYTGQVTIGYYTIEDGLLVMTNGSGVPVRNDGRRYEHKLGPKDKPAAVASVMTRQIRKELYGDVKRGPLQYQHWGF